MEFKIEEKDGNIEVLARDGEKSAKATCFINNTPKYEGKNISTIGNFETNNIELGVEILKKCEEIIKEKGFDFIVAPMNGNTWKKYRVLTYSSSEPNFILENTDPIQHNEILQKAGFEKLYTYTSTKGKIGDYVRSKYADVLGKKIKENKITIRHFDKDNYLEDLKKIYSVIIQSFGRNQFYTSVKEEDFLKQYIPYFSIFDEDLILIAEKNNKAVGFLFTIPNLDKKSLVVKTGAVLPEYEKIALGSVILDELQKKAKEKGYMEWIFAFMYQNNTSQKSAKRHNTKIIREYALYAKKI